MKQIAIIHTVKKVLNTFEPDLKEMLQEEVKVHNILDEFLASNANEIGEFSIDNRNRLFQDIKSAELTGADVIAVTCSTLTPAVNMIRPFVKVPLIAIDDAMAKKAAKEGNKILVLASAQSTIQPTVSKIQGEADAVGKSVTIDFQVCDEAYDAVKRLDLETHDRLFYEIAEQISGYDCIVLAQASMAHLEDGMAKRCNCLVLSSPKLCMKQICETL